MEKRNLTFEEWSHLSEEEKGERYRELSDHDKFIVRVSIDGVPNAQAPEETATEEQRIASIREAEDALGIDLNNIEKSKLNHQTVLYRAVF